MQHGQAPRDRVCFALPLSLPIVLLGGIYSGAFTPTDITETWASESGPVTLGFALDGTDHPTHAEQARMIRRYIAWRNRHADDKRLREVVNRANVA